MQGDAQKKSSTLSQQVHSTLTACRTAEVVCMAVSHPFTADMSLHRLTQLFQRCLNEIFGTSPPSWCTSTFARAILYQNTADLSAFQPQTQPSDAQDEDAEATAQQHSTAAYPTSCLCDELAQRLAHWLWSRDHPHPATLLADFPLLKLKQISLPDIWEVFDPTFVHAVLDALSHPHVGDMRKTSAHRSQHSEVRTALQRLLVPAHPAEQQKSIADDGMASSCSDHDHTAILQHHLRLSLERLGARGVLDLLGMRHTEGSVEALPPAVDLCLEAFRRPHKAQRGSILSVGARALCKHCHRDMSAGFWGSPTGPEAQKNQHAEDVLARILSDVQWMNVHLLPHDNKVFEVRCGLGYGARWSADGTSFRGFLEPQMEDGHERGWRH